MANYKSNALSAIDYMLVVNITKDSIKDYHLLQSTY